MKPFMTIRVGAIDVEVFRMPLEDDTFGDFSYINTRIRIDDRLEGATLVDTLLHEINHVVWAVGQLKNKTQKEERAVAVMATYWTQIFRDNPQLLTWIKKNLTKS